MDFRPQEPRLSGLKQHKVSVRHSIFQMRNVLFSGGGNFFYIDLNNRTGNLRCKYYVIMKKIAGFLCSIPVTALMLTSCGGSKPAVQPTQPSQSIFQEAKQTQDECEMLQEQQPDIRAYGMGISRDASRAKQLAESDARASYVRTLESVVKSAEEVFGSGYNNNGGKDEAGLDNTMRMTIAQGVARNMVIIKSERFIRADGSYRVAVCLEYRGDRKQLANDLAQKSQQVSDDDRIKIKYDYEKFRERIEDELAKVKH